MGIEDRKDIRIMFLIAGGFFLAVVPFFVAELFYPMLMGFQGLPYLIFALFLVLEGSLTIAVGIRFRKMTMKGLCRGISIYEFAINPLFMISTLAFAVFLPKAEATWLYFVNTGLIFFLFVVRMVATLQMTRLLKQGEPVLIGFRNHSINACSFLLIALNFYVFSMIKQSGLDISAVTTQGMAALTELYIWITIAEVFVSMFLLSYSLFVTVCTYLTAKENLIVDFRTNFKATKDLLIRNDVAFWGGIMITFFLWLLSLISTVRLFNAYFSLFFLYTIILLIRIPGFIRKKNIEKKYFAKPYIGFLKKHWIFIYSGILLIAYAIVCIVFGQQNLSEIATQASDDSELITLAIFVPWAIIKIFLSARNYKVAKQNIEEPLAVLNAYLDILVAIYTLAKSVFIITGYTRFEWVKTTGIVIGTMLTIYSIYCSVKLLFLGILGVRGMRAFPYESLLETIKHVRQKRKGTWTAAIPDETYESEISGPTPFAGEVETPKTEELETKEPPKE